MKCVCCDREASGPVDAGLSCDSCKGALAINAQGSAQFNQGALEAALELYSNALALLAATGEDCLPDCPSPLLQEPRCPGCRTAAATVLCNRVAAQLRLGRNEVALRDAFQGVHMMRHASPDAARKAQVRMAEALLAAGLPSLAGVRAERGDLGAGARLLRQV